MFIHNPVMVAEVLSYLSIESDDIVVDCTLGEGGHSSHFLQKANIGTVLGIEQDAGILESAVSRLKDHRNAFIPVRDNFSNLKNIVSEKIGKKVDKIFFDLGVSMYHIRKSGRGFSFSKDEPLDMRLDLTRSLKGMDVVNRFDQKKLAEIIWAYGEEKFSARISHFIIQERAQKPITTSIQLADIVKKGIPRKYWPKNIHPATKTFQAIRIFVNDEIEILEKALKEAIESLKPGGRIGVISFHSLEDRIVKSVFRELAKGCTCPADFPVCVCGKKRSLKVLTKKPLSPDEGEKNENPASRSARFRCAVKIDPSVKEAINREKEIA